MLEQVKKYSNRKVRKTFEDKYIERMMEYQDISLNLELQYIQKHNKLDVLKLDSYILSSLKGVL